MPIFVCYFNNKLLVNNRILSESCGGIVQDLGICTSSGLFQIFLVLSYFERYLPNLSFLKCVFLRKHICGAGTILLHLAFIREIMLCASDSVFEIHHRVKEANSATVLCAS